MVTARSDAYSVASGGGVWAGLPLPEDPGTLVGDVWTPGRHLSGIVTDASWALVPTGRWIEVAGTRIDSLTAEISALDLGWTSDTLWGTTGGNSIFQSWSGFAQDEDLGRLWFLGGGHSDGYNNGLYRFDTDKMRWAIECRPSNRNLLSSAYLTNGSATGHPDATAEMLENFNANSTPGVAVGTIDPVVDGPFYDEIPLDGKPTARHTYQGIIHVPTVGASGSVFLHARRLWRYDIASGAWAWRRLVNDQATARAGLPPTATSVAEVHAAEAGLVLWDEETNRVLCSASGSAGYGAFAFDWDTQSWSSWTGSYSLNYNDAAHVRVGRTAVAFRLPRQDAPVIYPGLVWQHNLDTGVTQSAAVQFAGGISTDDFVYGSYDGAGLVYVPPINRYWVCTRMASGMQWFQLDPTTTPWTMSPLTFANAHPVQQILLLNRVQWVEAINSVVVFDHCFANGSIYRF